MEDLVSQPIRVTRTNSMAPELTRDDDSTDSIQQEGTSILQSRGRDSMDTEWTDEKHSLYLKSMEASFVNQLYNSSGLLGWRSQNDCLSDPKSSRQMGVSCTRIASGQFKVLQDGCWAKINFRRDESQLNKADGSRVLTANPWIRHFRSGCRHHIVTSAPQEKPALVNPALDGLPVSHSRLCGQDSVGSNTEGTGQNFVDEDVEREKVGTKRMKTSVVATSSNDQVVPFGKFPITEDVAVNCGSLEE